MNWKDLFLKQKELDRYIQENHGLEEEDLVSRKILAFQVELGELANETRCFKFWSLKPASPSNVILEEYVDGLHFLLSLGLELSCTFEFLEPATAESDMTKQFQRVYRFASGFEEEPTAPNYRLLFAAFLALGRQLQLTEHGVMEAYWEKNQVNRQRQEEGY